MHRKVHRLYMYAVQLIFAKSFLGQETSITRTLEAPAVLSLPPLEVTFNTWIV